MAIITGGCACGKVRFEAEGEPDRVGICHCPTSNMVLASGTCRTRDLEASGCKVGLGVDGSASSTPVGVAA